MLRFVGWILVTTLLVSACGSSDKGAGGTGAGGTAVAAAGGGTGVGGGASSGGTPGAGGRGLASGGASVGGEGGALVCPPVATTLASGACYVPCVYEPGTPPRYEMPGGVCTSIGWKCSVLQHCNPNIHCLQDSSCQEIGGKDWVCVPTPDGPLVGQCAIACKVDSDCPDTKGATSSPYLCKPVTNGTVTVNICRF